MGRRNASGKPCIVLVIMIIEITILCIHAGTSSLYKACISYVLNHTADFEALLQFLPAHIQSDIARQKHLNINLECFIVAKL